MNERKALRVQPRKWNPKFKSEVRHNDSQDEAARLTAVEFLQFFPITNALGIESIVDEQSFHMPMAFRHSLGAGASFKVTKAIHPQDRSDLVLKSAAEDSMGDRESRSIYMRSLISELRVMGHPPLRDHPNIAGIQGLTWHCNESYDPPILPALVMEYSSLGTLDNFLNKAKPELSVRVRLCLDVARGLKELHRCGILHSDIKAENILVFGSEKMGFCAKISDFGSSLLDCDDSRSLCRVSITRPWNAPETEYGRGISVQDVWKTDIFPYGMLCWRALMGDFSFPFNLDNESRCQTIQKLKTGGGLAEIAVRSLEEAGIVDELGSLVSILTWTLQPDPNERIGNLDQVIDVLVSVVAPDKSFYPE
jgi:serine/threonine protein kinase